MGFFEWGSLDALPAKDLQGVPVEMSVWSNFPGGSPAGFRACGRTAPAMTPGQGQGAVR